MSAIGLSAPKGASKYNFIGARAEFRHTDYHFQRSQSVAMRELPWEGRLKPLRPWNNIAFVAAAAMTLGTIAANIL